MSRSMVQHLFQIGRNPREVVAAALDSGGGAIQWPNQVFELEFSGPAGASYTENEPNWGAVELRVQEFWNRGVRGRGVRVGVADSGCDLTHPALRHTVESGHLISFAAFDLDGNVMLNVSGNEIAGNPPVQPTFSHWHGTHCLAILAGELVDGVLRGVAPEVDLVVAQVLDAGNRGSVKSFQAGFRWLLTQECDIISLSLGWEGKHEEWAQEIAALINAGSVVIAASGNEFGLTGSSPTRSPANYPFTRGLLAVGAIDQSGQVWAQSGGELITWPDLVRVGNEELESYFRGSAQALVPTLVAPGVDIISAGNGTTYRSISGTSQAVPHAAGILSLVLSALRQVNPSTTPADALQRLLDSLIDVPPAAPDIRSGRGRIDVDLLLQSLQ